MITGLYAAIAGLFLVFLSIRVINVRRTEKVSVGHQGNSDLERAMRVQANFVEYTPIALFLLFISEVNGLPGLFVHLLGIAFLIARYAHFSGFKSAGSTARYRILGMVGTFNLIALLAFIVIVQYILKFIW